VVLFVKPFHQSSLENLGLTAHFPESFYSINEENVIRGMHFQLPPHDHDKIVYCSKGKLLDVVLDLRSNSKTFGKSMSFLIKENSFKGIYIPAGMAHGFASLEKGTIMTYLTSTEYHPDSDAGIRFDSFGFDWKIDNPILSDRDMTFPSFQDFNSPFK
jgi:dTDP-4-dehydrorhamnose 3,5-epimerase